MNLQNKPSILDILKPAIVQRFVLGFLCLVVWFSLLPNAFADQTIENGETFILDPGEVLSIDGNLTIETGGTLDASATNTTIIVTGDWSNQGSFISGTDNTVEFNGTADQNILGNTSFHHVTATTAAAGSARTLGFEEDQTQTMTGQATLTGASGQILSLRTVDISGTELNDGSQATIDFRGTETTDFLDVRDHIALSGNSAVSLPILPANSTNSGNTVDWFNDGFGVTVNQASSQVDPTGLDRAVFTVVFAEAVNVSTFTDSDIALSGTSGSVTSGPSEVTPNDGTTFEFVVSGMTSEDVVTASLPQGVVSNAGSTAVNGASTSVDNQVTYDADTDTDGDGMTDSQECLTPSSCTDTDSDGTPDYQDADDDNDGVASNVENSGFNQGDGNGDGFLDSFQQNVGTTNNALTGSSSTMLVQGDCSVINDLSVVAESSLGVVDEQLSYPVGLFDFVVDCPSPGDTADVTIYLTQEYDTSNWEYNKFDPNTNEYVDITSTAGVVYGTAVVGSQTVTTIQYSVTDGSSLDTDLAMNSSISDPSGPGVSDGTLIRLVKTANKSQAMIGDVVTYTLEVENISGGPLGDVTVRDWGPSGFKYVSGSAQLNGTPLSNPTGVLPYEFTIGALATDEKSILRYQMVVGSGVTFEEYTNVALAYASGLPASNQAREIVEIVPDALFDLGTVLGKVFHDRNGDGYQNEGEEGVSYAKIVMEDGTQITADVNGLFHVPGVIPGRHVFRLDERSLPEGSMLTTRKKVIEDITEGLPVKINFGVQYGQEFEGKEIPFVVEQSKNAPVKRLSVSLFNKELVMRKGKLVDPAVFHIFTNYHLFVDQWVLQILDLGTEKVVHSLQGNQEDIFSTLVWDGRDRQGQMIFLDRDYGYRLVVLNDKGQMDQTKIRPISLMEDRENQYIGLKEQTDAQKINYSRIYSLWMEEKSTVNDLVSEQIYVRGESVKVRGTSPQVLDLELRSESDEQCCFYPNVQTLVNHGLTAQKLLNQPGILLDVENKETDETYTFFDMILPNGEYVVSSGSASGENLKDISDGDQTSADTYQKTIKVGDDYLFFVAMGDGIVGYTDTDDIEEVQQGDRYEDGFWADGKLAYYLKGKIRGKYLIESSFDTDRKRKEIFKNLDPDQYYPVYGDESSINYQSTDTQGMLYLKVNWDKNEIKWGNFQTGMTDTELTAFNRTLYGGKAHFESLSTTKYGESKTKVITFVADAHQRSAHNEFLATGGSLYYLKHTDVIEGSDQLKIEIRDQVTGLVLSEKSLSEPYDYLIDYNSGRVLLSQPLSMVAKNDAITSTHLLAGHPVYLVVDYQYETNETFDETSYGGRAQQAINDHVILGGTYVKEQQLEMNYELSGADATVHFGDDMTVKVEYARSDSATGQNFISTDGGLSFTDLSSSSDVSGEAYSGTFEGFFWENKLGVKMMYQWIDQGFSNTGSISQQGKETIGFESVFDLDQSTRVTLTHDLQKILDGGNAQTNNQVGASKTESTRLQLIKTISERWKVTGEYRRQNVDEPLAVESETNQDEDLIAVRADHKLNEKTDIYLQQQLTLSSDAQDNDQTAMGVVYDLTDHVNLRAEHKQGDQGSASSVGATVNIKDKLKLSGDYTVLTDASGQRISTFGANSGLINGSGNLTVDSDVSGTNGGSADATTISASYDVDETTAVRGSVAFNGLTAGNESSSITLGTTKKIDDQTTVIMDRQMAFSDEREIHGNSLGWTKIQDEKQWDVRYTDQVSTSATDEVVSNVFEVSTTLTENWAAGVGYERGRVNNLDGTQDKRDAVSLRFSYLEKDDQGKTTLKLANKFEYRIDDGQTDEHQFLVSSYIEGKILEDVTVFGKVEWSETKDKTLDQILAEYQEFTIGGAYRPLRSDRLNLLMKYSYIHDDAPVGQLDASDILEETFQVLGFEAIFDLTDQWQLTKKIAYKWGDETVDDFSSVETETWLWINRLGYTLNDRWTFIGEYRYLAQDLAQDSKHGALLEVRRQIGEEIQIGLGYNFTEFNDDLTNLDFRSQGPYFRVTFGLDESLLDKFRK